jgi:CheY-like chemotaxis protein
MDQCGESSWDDFQADLAKINQAAKTWLGLMEHHLLGEARQGIPPHRLAGDAETEAFTRIHQADAPAAPHSTPNLPAGQGRLLLADDDESNRELLQRRLNKLGYQVTVCGDGREALERVMAGQFDLVLLDLLMPGLDGREVLARLKADSALRHLPVIQDRRRRFHGDRRPADRSAQSRLELCPVRWGNDRRRPTASASLAGPRRPPCRPGRGRSRGPTEIPIRCLGRHGESGGAHAASGSTWLDLCPRRNLAPASGSMPGRPDGIH